MSEFCRVYGQKYLRRTLTEVTERVCALDSDFEVRLGLSPAGPAEGGEWREARGEPSEPRDGDGGVPQSDPGLSWRCA